MKLRRKGKGKFIRTLLEKRTFQVFLLVVATACIASFLIAISEPEANQEVQRGENGEYIVELREDGFYPVNLSIGTGDTVLFRTTRSEAFWPASDMHPSHTVYPEFDPRIPLDAGESWRFVFEKEGSWRYHDHLFPYYVGVITVGQGGTQDCEEQQAPSRERREYCWKKALEESFQQGGVQASFETLSEFYREDEAFEGAGCHLYAHTIGDIAYGAYLRDDFDFQGLPPETAHCGFGFYHGFLEHFLRDNPKPELAKGICGDLERDLSDTIPRIRLNCYHSIGHGFVPDPPPASAWGNPSAMVEDGIRICQNISTDSQEVSECVQGVFNVMAMWMWSDSYGLSGNPEAPFAFCEEQSVAVAKEACYYELAMPLGRLVNNDIAVAADRFMMGIEEDEYARVAMGAFVGALMQDVIGQDDFSEYIRACNAVAPRLQDSCLRGVTGGFVAHGEPDKEYVKALEFCASEQLSPSQKDTCYFNIIRTFKGVYPKEKVEDICSVVEDPYKHYCKAGQ